MSLARREFVQALSAAAAAGLALGRWAEADAASAQAGLYELPPFGQASLLHFTDSHAQLLPLHYREADDQASVAWPAFEPGSALAHAFTPLGFEAAARRFGRVGGFAHLATLVKQLQASRPGALLLDGGDTWQGSATALWSGGQDMVRACRQLGVAVMTGHWEFTLGAARMQQLIAEAQRGQTAFVAHNVETADFGEPVFEPFVLREINRVPCAIIGQAYPYTPIAHPRWLLPDWRFGIQEAGLQAQINAARRSGAQLVVLLSHNGLALDLKLASRVSGLDAILGGHTHDPLPQPIVVANPGGRTLVSNAGSHGKFLGVFDFELSQGRLRDWRYRLLPVFANQLAPDPAMAALIAEQRVPYAARLAEPLAITDGLLYRRSTFGGPWDQLIGEALRDELGCEIAFSPGFRWGGCLLPGEAITRERLMEQLAISYPQTTRRELSGAQIKALLEDVADNLFNPDPYYQQGGDMVRSVGLRYRLAPGQPMGQRISELRLNGRLLEADKRYTVAGWAPMAEPDAAASASRSGAGGGEGGGTGSGTSSSAPGEPVWALVERWLRAQASGVGAGMGSRAGRAPGHITPHPPERPELAGGSG